jgi:hypothetical protein
MHSLAMELKLNIAETLSLADLCTLSCVSKELHTIGSTFLFTAVKLRVAELSTFQQALDVNFKACNVRSLCIYDDTGLLRAAVGGNSDLSYVQTNVSIFTRLT